MPSVSANVVQILPRHRAKHNLMIEGASGLALYRWQSIKSDENLQIVMLGRDTLSCFDALRNIRAGAN